MPPLALYLLGSPKLTLNDQPLVIPKQKAFALLAYLVVTRESHRRDRLATLFWPDYDQQRARTYLRQALYELNQRLDAEWFITTRENIGVAPAAIQVDVHDFLDRVISVRKVSHSLTATAVEELREAVALYRDDFLAGFTLPDCLEFDEWQFFQAEHLRQAFAEALQCLLQWHTEKQAYPEAIAWARRWLAQDPLHEPGHQKLMALYAQAGQYTAALHQYETCVHLLEKELAAPPVPETTALYEAIKARRLPPARSSPPSTRDLSAHTNQELCAFPGEQCLRTTLPSFSSPLIGREADLAMLDRLFADPHLRLLTLLGPGGIGKTRLSVAAAERLRKTERFPQGVYFVPLATVHEPAAIWPVLAKVLALPFEPTHQPTTHRQQQLFDYLRNKRLLLVFDNFEHFLSDVAFLSELLSLAPGVCLLVTSRARLQLQDEQVYRVQGLAYPAVKSSNQETTYAASTLFLQRAARVQPDFVLTSADWTPLYHICQLVEGLPLAIELAAAWVDVLTLAQIAIEIQQSLDFLQTAAPDVPVRHRSLRAVFDTSWQQLSTVEQELFAQLAVFRGGFTRQAAHQVTSISLPLLRTLAAKSLLQFETRSERYTIHELLRQYGVAKLGEQPEQAQAMQSRHSAYYCGWLYQRKAELKSGQQRDALAAIECEHENIRIAWQWALQNQQWDRIRQATDSLGTFYEWQGRYAEGEASFLAASAALGSVSTVEAQILLAHTLAWRSVFVRVRCEMALARHLLEQSLTLLQQLRPAHDVCAVHAFALLQLGHWALDRDNEAADTAYTQSLALCRQLGDPGATASALVGLGQLAQFRGDYSQVRAYYQESLELYARLGNQLGMASVLDALSLNARYEGRLEESERLARASYHHGQQVGNQVSQAKGLFSVALALDWLGKGAEALVLMQDTLVLYEDVGDRRLLAAVYTRIGNTEIDLGYYVAGDQHVQQGLTLALEFGDQRLIGFALENLSRVAVVEGRYAEAQGLLESSLGAYRQAGVRAEAGRVCVGLAHFACKQGNLPLMRHYVIQALQIGLELPDLPSALSALGVIAVYLADTGEMEQALALDALCRQSPMFAQSRFYEEVISQPIATLATRLSPEKRQAAQRHGQALDVWQTAAAWLALMQSQV